MNIDDDDDPVAMDDVDVAMKTTTHESPRPQTIIRIVSANYGASAGRRLLTGEISGAVSAPYTRDVAPFIRALLLAHRQQENDEPEDDLEGDEHEAEDTEMGDPENDEMIRLGSGVPGKNMFLPLMDGKSMNTIFGDPCPGTSKQLAIHYVIYEAAGDARSRAAASEVHRVTFSEHERVILRRRMTFFQDECKLKNAVAATTRRAACRLGSVDSNSPAPPDMFDDCDEDESSLLTARRMGRAQSIAELAQDTFPAKRVRSSITEEADKSLQAMVSPGLSATRWRLRSATSEIVLPIVMAFLEVAERVRCQIVCKSWHFIVQYYGVAKTVDINDPSFPSSRSFLRGIMSHSYSSLQSLFLNDFRELSKDDLHPALPHLRKLRSLDISRCEQLDDSTLKLISQHLNRFLEVLYMKRLRKVTDEGLISICMNCMKLQVLEISSLPITDESGLAIGENLNMLRALYMRDNYLLTNRSIDVITEKCTRLTQLTLWGCTRLTHLSFDSLNHLTVTGCGNLVLLNLWGCHSLLDEAANAFAPMTSLRSLIASECHRLTDAFVVGLANNVPQLVHLQLRYCKRLTDAGVNVITNSMPHIYALDLSFCTRISVSSLFNLLEIRKYYLSELRVQNCHQLDIAVDPEQIDPSPNAGYAGRSLLNAIRSDGGCCLCILDVRSCGGQRNVKEPFPDNDLFVQGMRSLGFQQAEPGFFSRPARWNSMIQQRLIEEVMSMTT